MRFTAATAIGLAEAEVRARAGPPDMVIAGDEAMESGRLAGYLRSAKPVEQRVLVYFRYGHAVLVYIGRDGYVSTVYWAQPR